MGETGHIFIFYPAVATLRDLVGRAVSRAAKRAYLKGQSPLTIYVHEVIPTCGHTDSFGDQLAWRKRLLHLGSSAPFDVPLNKLRFRYLGLQRGGL